MTKIVARGDPIEPVYLNNLRVAAHGWGVVSGLTVSQRAAGANMSVDVASGEAWINGTKITKGSTTNVVITAAHATYDRYDLVVINSSGTISVIAGTAAATSYANDYDLESANAILLAEVEVPATDTTIETAQCTDKRIISFIEETDVANGIPRLDSSADIPTAQLKTNVAGGVPLLDGSAKVTSRLSYEGAASGVAVLNSSSKITNRLSYEGVASGVPSLDASSKITNRLSYEDVANGVPSLDASSRLSVSQGGVPTGAIMMWHGLISNIPTGWTLCDGSSGTPDLRSKFVRGAPASTEAGGTGGADTHTLTIAQMPAHVHSMGIKDDGSWSGDGWTTPVAGAKNTGSTGGGAAHNNMPAYYQILFIMKT